MKSTDKPVEIAAPEIPYFGINNKLKNTLMHADPSAQKLTFFSLPLSFKIISEKINGDNSI